MLDWVYNMYDIKFGQTSPNFQNIRQNDFGVPPKTFTREICFLNQKYPPKKSRDTNKGGFS